MAGYNRNDTVNNIADGNIINASDLDGEFDAIDAAFDESTGHDHDATSGGGKPITKVGPTQDIIVGATTVLPKTDNSIDLGSATYEFKDLFIDGTANIDSLVADTAAISGGTISSVAITPRIGTVTSAATITPTSATSDQYNVTALAEAASIAAPSGTPVNGQKLIIRIKDNGTARALTWTTTSGGYRVVSSPLPATTIVNKTVYIGCIYNSADTFWDVIGVAQET